MDRTTLSDDALEQLAPSEDDQLAKNAMTVDEVRRAVEEQLSAGAYIQREYDVDPAAYDSESAFIDAVREARRDTEGE